MEKLNIVISGCFTEQAIGHYGRKKVAEMIRYYGHNVQEKICGNTNYLCVGEANVPGRGVGPAKLAKAKAMNVKIVTLEQLTAVLDAA